MTFKLHRIGTSFPKLTVLSLVLELCPLKMSSLSGCEGSRQVVKHSGWLLGWVGNKGIQTEEQEQQTSPSFQSPSI